MWSVWTNGEGYDSAEPTSNGQLPVGWAIHTSRMAGPSIGSRRAMRDVSALGKQQPRIALLASHPTVGHNNLTCIAASSVSRHRISDCSDVVGINPMTARTIWSWCRPTSDLSRLQEKLHKEDVPRTSDNLIQHDEQPGELLLKSVDGCYSHNQSLTISHGCQSGLQILCSIFCGKGRAVLAGEDERTALSIWHICQHGHQPRCEISPQSFDVMRGYQCKIPGNCTRFNTICVNRPSRSNIALPCWTFGVISLAARPAAYSDASRICHLSRSHLDQHPTECTQAITTQDVPIGIVFCTEIGCCSNVDRNGLLKTSLHRHWTLIHECLHTSSP